MGPEMKPQRAMAEPEPASQLDKLADKANRAQKHFHEDPNACQGILKQVQTKFPLAIKESLIAGAGSGLFVEADIPEGEEIFRSQPLVSCRDPRLEDVCDYCLFSSSSIKCAKEGSFGAEGQGASLDRCTGCKYVRYCSQTCQKKAWTAYHKQECQLLKETPGISPMILALFRILLWDKAGKISPGYWKVLMMLEDCSDLHSEEDDGDAFQLVVEAIRRNVTHRTVPIVWKLYNALTTNTMNIRPADVVASYGISLDLAICMINHDCDPNTYIFFGGNQLRLRSLKPIAAGDELTISYCSTSLGVHARRAMLQKSHFIDCTCKCCNAQLKQHNKDSLAGGSSPRKLQDAQKQLGELGSSIRPDFVSRPSKQGKSAVLDNFVKEVKKVMCEALPRWPDGLDPLPDVRLTLFSLYRDQGQLGAAVMYCLKGSLHNRAARKGPDWAHCVLDLVALLAQVGQLPLDDQLFTAQTGFPERAEVQLVACGYMVYLGVAMTKTYGADCRFVRAYLRWVRAFMAIPGLPEPDQQGFAELFDKVQGKLLAWAGVGAEKRIVLPDQETIRGLLDAITASDFSALSVKE